MNQFGSGKIGGSGILIVENYNNKPYLLLFSGKSNDYDEPGGVLDEGEKSEETACRETREETCNIINIKPDELKMMVTPQYQVYIKTYLAYILYIENINIKDFEHNVKKVFKNCKDRHWKEKYKITRVPINNILQSIESNINLVYDIDHKAIMVRERTLAIVKKALKILTNINLSCPITLTRNITQNSKMRCLIGTYTYTLHKYEPITKQSTPQIAKPRIHEFGIYAIPNNTKLDLYITIIGFSNKHPPLKINLDYISNLSNIPWKIDLTKINIKNNRLYFQSRTLDKIANILANNNFQKIKGKKFSNTDWNILKNMLWSLVIVKKEKNGNITFGEKYLLNKI